MEKIGFEILFIFLMIVINGLFSMSEIAVLSARKVRLEKLAGEGNLGAIAALKLADTPDKFLSTVQIGITLVGILTGAVGGAALAAHLEPVVAKISFLAPYAQEFSFAFVVLVITYFSLVIGELLPKRLALNAPEKIASAVSRPMTFVSKLTAPLVWILSISTKAVFKMLRKSKAREEAITEEEIRALLIQGKTAGVLEETEQELMESVFRLDDQLITALMTPRRKIGWIDLQDSDYKLHGRIKDFPFSRLLIGDEDLDNIRGFVKSKDLLNFFIDGKKLEIETVIKEPLFIPETATALDVLEKFRDSNTHMAVVVDEFGSTLGIVTTNDILEAIVGDLPFGGIRKNSAVQREDGTWLLDGRLSNGEFCDILGINALPLEEKGMYETLAGFIIKRLEKLPVTGDKFEWENHVFEVVDMDGNRVDQVLASARKENSIPGEV